MPSAAPDSAETGMPRRLAPSGPGAPRHALSGTGHGFAGMVAAAAGGAVPPAPPAPAGSLPAARPEAAAATTVRSGASLAPGVPAAPPSTATGAAPPASARPGPSGKDAEAGPGGLAKLAGKDDAVPEHLPDGLQTPATGLADALLPVLAGVGQAPRPQGAILDAAAALAATAAPTGEGGSGPPSGGAGRADAKAMPGTETIGGVAPSLASAGPLPAGSPSAGARPSNAAQSATEGAGTAPAMDPSQPSGGAPASTPTAQASPGPVQPSPSAATPAADGTRTQAGLHPGPSGATASVEVSPFSPVPGATIQALAAPVQPGAQQPAQDRAAGVAGPAALAIRRPGEAASPSGPGDAPAASAKAAGPGAQPAAGPPATAIPGAAPGRNDAGAMAATASDAPPLDKGDPAPGTPWPSMMAAAATSAPVQAPAVAPSAAAAGPPHAVPATPTPDQLGPAFLAAASPAGPSRVVVRLDPAELGLVQVGITRQPSGPARIELMAERPETLQLLMRDQPALHRALDLAGVPAEGRTLHFQLGAPDAARDPAPAPAPQPGAAAGGMGSDSAGNGGGFQPRGGHAHGHGHAPGRAGPSLRDADPGLAVSRPPPRPAHGSRASVDITA